MGSGINLLCVDEQFRQIEREGERNGKGTRNLTLEQQAKLISEIDAVTKLEDDELAEANAEEIKSFIDMLHAFGFIGSDKKSRYILGLDMAMKRRGKRK